MSRKPMVDRMLLAQTRVRTLKNDLGLSSASGFFFRCNGRTFLITSRHVFLDDASGHTPDKVEITYHLDPYDLRRVEVAALPLYAEGHASWI
ncbi:MAG: serine protease, partial [Armatimonadaceae bacterium]